MQHLATVMERRGMNTAFVVSGGETAAGDGPVDGFGAEAPDEAAVAAEPGLSALDDKSRCSVGAAHVDDRMLADLLDRIVRHDEHAFEAFHDVMQRRVCALARRFSRDAALVDEVVEEAFFRVWRDAPRFDPARGRASAWVLAIVRSRMLDALRRQERSAVELPAEDDEIEAASPPDRESDPLRQVDATRRALALQAALTRLDPQPRQLVSLAFFRGLSHEEVAAETGLPLGTVKSSIRRALGTLKAWLDPAMAAGPAL